ncbi:hypothetical protein KDI_49330 [Dictyobacter arantiisoli]|uniref:Uncharacterized protein n=2 Tax=Dictyobacter arantiisoli TaxID=2014874 RepID=A0A5A5TK13_9CHLR|nr:hypothetical protein KDI_49330 [Dictyobacter arantiisoli]
MQTNNYEILRNTWIYQEIQQLIQTEIQQQQRDEHCQILLSIVQARFPRILAQARPRIIQIQDQASLRTLIVQIGSARTEKEARQQILQLPL